MKCRAHLLGDTPARVLSAFRVEADGFDMTALLKMER